MKLDYEKFVSVIESYYGKYSTPEKKKIILKYIMGKYPEEVLDELLKKIVRNFSSQYKSPPDIAMIEEMLEENVEMGANEVWEEICRNANVYRDMVFSDPVAYMAFKNATGGLHAFSLRKQSEEHWVKKRFLEMYALYQKNPPDCDYLMLRGVGNFGEPVMIGDVERCKQIAAARGSAGNDLVRQLTAGIKTMGED